jgi:hypothetical protein
VRREEADVDWRSYPRDTQLATLAKDGWRRRWLPP